MRIRLTTDMTAAEMEPLWPQVFECLSQYCERFPEDDTPEHMIAECAEGKRQLWLIQDEDGRVLLTPITEIRTIDATGRKRLTLAQVAGERLKEAMPLLKEIEDWAIAEHGVDAVEMLGRKGWAKLLPEYGYRQSAILFRKELK